MQLFARNYDSLIAGLVGSFIIWMFARHSGIGISPDSVIYAATAGNVAQHGLLEDFKHLPLVDFPACYPLFLGAIQYITRHDVLSFAPLLNSLLFGIVIFLSGWIMEKFRTPSKWYKWAILSCIVLSPALLEVYSMLWSETLFILLILLFIIFLHHYFKTLSTPALIVSALIVGLACITRYAGITFIGTGLFLVFVNSRLSWRKKITHLFLFGIISSLFLAINLLRNKYAGSTLTGHREKSLTPVQENIRHYGNVFIDWLPTGHHYAFALPIAIIIIAGSSVWFAWWALRRKTIETYEQIAIICFVTYTLFLVLSATIYRYEHINSRLLSPLFITLLWSFTSWIPSFIKTRPVPRQYMAIGLCVLAFIAFQYNQAQADSETWDGVKDAGVPGYTEDSWQFSPTVDFIKRNKHLLLKEKDVGIYSDAADAVYFLTGLYAMQLPHKEFKQELEEMYNDDHYYIIWFYDGENPDLVSADEIARHHQLCVVQQFKDGIIYEAMKKH